MIVELGFSANGRLKGKDAMRPYWMGLALRPAIHFEIVEVFAGVESVSIFYRSVGRKLVCESFVLDDHRKVIRSTASYGRPA